MLSILRKIRRNFLKQNKITQYLLYALGEIVLIVLGILIALAINNNNQYRQTLKREQFYLTGLKSEFQRSKAKLQTLMEVNRLNYEKAKEIANYIAQENPMEETELSKLLFESLSYEIAYNPNNALLNELINSGGLKDISSVELRTHLTNWESQLQSVNRQEATLRDQRERLLDVTSKQGSIRTVFDLSGIAENNMGLQVSDKKHASNQEVVKSKEFENVLLVFILTGKLTETSHYQPLMEEIDQILELIDKEIRT